MLRAVRWRLQLRAIDIFPTMGQMTYSIFGCYALNLLFPRLGEFWRSAYIAKGSNKPFSGVFGSMVADRISDSLMVGILGIIGFIIATGAMLSFMQESTLFETIGSILISWPVILAAAILLICSVYIMRSKSRIAQKIRTFVSRTWHGFAVVFHMPKRGLWALLTIGIWASYVASMYISMLAFTPTAELVSNYGFACALITFVFGAFSMGIPSNGGIGPWQIAIMMSLSGIFGMAHDSALAFATINLAASTILTIILGIGTFVTIALKTR